MCLLLPLASSAVWVLGINFIPPGQQKKIYLEYLTEKTRDRACTVRINLAITVSGLINTPLMVNTR